ncbi:S1C family serine protease [Amphibacillus xylanus]|uniref:Peptidase S1 family protein n=1 Tax=Amphibacillus xylanus (strain ATCC 51415 / DSM 6626 / JCM 7361 / LMG 17667 / NBRC 15112 / Ep01) TaxID=698758 RepID=K0J7Q3_AMPXN|nr:trypsin-like peptidase domain-containing protein [Amphibacillus xylanus]BAM47768.1 peptidase S1 family protein [Amphibacillus xylanus NBRC 15112]
MQKQKKATIIFLSLLILIFGLAFILFFINSLQKQDIDVGQPLVIYQEQILDTDNLQHLIHEAQKSVVQINVQTRNTERVGSGFLYNSRGDIMTNAHVIKDAISIEVTMSNAETYPAAIVGLGEDKDIAVIRVPQLINYQPIEIEATDQYQPGTEILAVGSPLGFQNTVSIGIISGVDRSFDINGYNYENVYQISANITHGNSGGPLINRETGKVIGINSAGIEESDIGFSIPIPTIIDDVTEWSTSITNDQLTFPTRVQNLTPDPEVFEEEALYLIDYFFNSLAINDYINAYTLLGSSLHSELDYPSFRSSYVHFRNLSLLNSEIINSTSETIQLSASIQYEDLNDLNNLKTAKYTFTIGYEIDQLKVLMIEKE